MFAYEEELVVDQFLAHAVGKELFCRVIIRAN